MRPLRRGGDQNIVYVYNEVPPTTSTAFPHLRRYDVGTGQKTELPVKEGLSLEQAQVSADGQWVLFVVELDPRVDPGHVAKLQLIRMDGQGLQTLYCFPAARSSRGNFPLSAQWSTDQKSILLDVDTNETTSTLTLLEVANGVANPFETTISVGPTTGGARHTLYHGPNTTCVTAMRLASPCRLFLLVQSTADHFKTLFNQVWTLKPDGTGRLVLFSERANTSNGPQNWTLNPYTQFPWSNVSRNGNLYSFQAQAFIGNTNTQTLRLGSFNGGPPKVFASTSQGSLAMVGWTTM
jgi:hypothetical protein